MSEQIKYRGNYLAWIACALLTVVEMAFSLIRINRLLSYLIA